MSQYRSSYAESYLREDLGGRAYERGISNKFELAIFELEKIYLDRIYARRVSGRGDFAYLDYATGTGRILALLAGKARVAFAVDSSSLQLEHARLKVPVANFIADNIVTNPDCLPIKFDLITCFRLMLNLEEENRLPVLLALSRSLKRDGILVIDNHMNRYSILGLIAYFMKRWLGYKGKNVDTIGQKRISNTMSQREMVGVLNAAGFDIRKIYRFMIIPGHNGWTLLPMSLLVTLERIMAAVPGANRLGKNQIFVCEKKLGNQTGV